MFAFIRRVRLAFSPPVPASPSESPLKFGVLGAAKITPIALILPAKNHADVVVHAVAARDKKRADEYAKKYGIPKAYGGPEGYQALLDDPEIDVIYNPLPNGLHFEWTMKALAAGKHVLLEKPSADTADETRKMFEFAEKKGLVLMEAFHYRFHPATRRAKEIIDSGELGTITDVHTSLAFPNVGLFKDTDIRFSYKLGGGVFMDMGCYTLSLARHLTSADPVRVITANSAVSPKFAQIDTGTSAKLALMPADEGTQEITATLDANFRLPSRWGFIPQKPKIFAKVVGTKGELYLFNFVAPYLYHYITVQVKGDDGKTRKRTEKAYGIEGWTTYRYQLESFVDRLRGRTPDHWFTAQDSITNMDWIGKVYEATGLGPRPASEFVLTEAE